jgi:hypothetical protein
MADNDPVSERGRSLEDDYFRKKDRELVERMRRAAELEQARKDLSSKSGLHDPELLQELESLGFTPETVTLLPLLPVVQMAWAEGGVTDAERKLLVQLARSRGIAPGSAADRALTEWLVARPDPQVFARAMRLVRAMLAASPAEEGALTADELVKYCESIASASGGIFGINRISADERALLAAIASDLKQHQS